MCRVEEARKDLLYPAAIDTEIADRYSLDAENAAATQQIRTHPRGDDLPSRAVVADGKQRLAVGAESKTGMAHARGDYGRRGCATGGACTGLRRSGPTSTECDVSYGRVESRRFARDVDLVSALPKHPNQPPAERRSPPLREDHCGSWPRCH